VKFDLTAYEELSSADLLNVNGGYTDTVAYVKKRTYGTSYETPSAYVVPTGPYEPIEDGGEVLALPYGIPTTPPEGYRVYPGCGVDLGDGEQEELLFDGEIPTTRPGDPFYPDYRPETSGEEEGGLIFGTENIPDTPPGDPIYPVSELDFSDNEKTNFTS
jgi:hypothetical protein